MSREQISASVRESWCPHCGCFESRVVWNVRNLFRWIVAEFQPPGEIAGVGYTEPPKYTRRCLQCQTVYRPRFRTVGHCCYCGYDLRASKDRCPECGAAIPPKAAEEGATA